MPKSLKLLTCYVPSHSKTCFLEPGPKAAKIARFPDFQTPPEPACRRSLSDLGLDYVDLILLHGPSSHGATCDKFACEKDIGQWKAYEALYKAGKAKAIGVSNYCVSCYECLIGAPGVTVVPAVNQIEFHAGMGSDPAGMRPYHIGALSQVACAAPRCVLLISLRKSN